MDMKSSPRPKAKPVKPLAPKRSPRPKESPPGANYTPYAVDAKSKMASGGAVKEGSAKDMREDKAMAKKAGKSMKAWEASSADVAHDKPTKMAKGGVVRGGGAAIRGKKFSGSY